MNELNPSNRNLLIAIAVTLGIWGCAQNPGPSPKVQAEKIKTLEERLSKMEDDHQILLSTRDQMKSRISALEEDRTALEKARAELSTWQDPNYIKSQARERLHFVLPGERQYIVTGTDITKSQPQTTQIASQLPEGDPWYTKLIESVTESGL